MTFLGFLLGLGLLLIGAELLVRGASRLAAAFGIPPLIIGLTVVAFGTSAPELAVSVGAAFGDQANIALGNVLGSNIFNILFILGLSALISPLAVTLDLVRIEVPIMIGLSLLAVFFAWNGAIGRWEGAVLAVLGLAYILFQIYQSRRMAPTEPKPKEDGAEGSSIAWWNVLSILIGLGFLVLGSRFLVDSAVSLARALGLSELVIGLTIIAAGTSLPEVATSVMASLRRERDIAVGNVVGSNIFNLLWVLGLSSLVSDHGIQVSPEVLTQDFPVMLVAAIACLPIFFTGLIIARWEGGLFFFYYLAYTTLLILKATQSPALPIFEIILLGFLVPLTLLTLGILVLRKPRASGDVSGAS